MNTKMLSFMKFQKDTMVNPPSDATIQKLVATAKEIGATHCEVSTVLVHPNFITQTSRWVKAIHDAGLLVTFRNAHMNMEFTRNSNGTFSGLYGSEAWIGGRRKDSQIYLEEARKMILDHPDWYRDGDEFALYPERTEGIFQDNTSWLFPNSSDNYAQFFIRLFDIASDAFVQIGKKVKVGLSANNGSELLSGWMPQSLFNKTGVIVMDHYLDNRDPEKYALDVQGVKQRYGKPVYIQEWAFNRSSSNEVNDTPVIRAYYAMFKRLVDEGSLYGLGYWGGWSAGGEGILNSDLSFKFI